MSLLTAQQGSLSGSWTDLGRGVPEFHLAPHGAHGTTPPHSDTHLYKTIWEDRQESGECTQTEPQSLTFYLMGSQDKHTRTNGSGSWVSAANRKRELNGCCSSLSLSMSG